MVIHAHGEKEGFYLNDQSESIRASDFTSTLNQKIITRLEEEVYTPEMPWLFISCSTGAEDGIVSKVAKAFKGIAKGPKKNTGVSKITATFNSENDIAALSGTFTSNEGLVEEATYKQ